MAKQASPDPLYTLRGEMEAVHNVLFQLKDGSEYLYASTQTGAVHKWNLQSCREEFRVETSKEACLAVKFLQNYIVSQTKGGEIKLWEETNGLWNLRNVLNLDYWGFCKFDVYSDQFLVFAESGSKIRIVNTSFETVNNFQMNIEGNSGEIMAIKCFMLSGTDYIFVLHENGVLTLFEAVNGSKVFDHKITTDCPMALDFDGESKGVVGSSGDTVVGFELTKDLHLTEWKKATITNAGVSCVSIRPDKKLFSAGCWDASIRLFSMKSFKLLAVLQNHKQTVQDICYSPARVRAWECRWLLAAAGKDGRITLWNIY